MSPSVAPLARIELKRARLGGKTLGRVSSFESCGTVDGPGLRAVVFTAGCPLSCVYCHNPETRDAQCSEVMSAERVVARVLSYKNFLTGGGLTMSGGEPLAQPEFVQAVFEGVKEHDMHTALDTSGNLGHRASDTLLELTDLVLLDIKSFLPDLYRRLTGRDVRPTLDFARRLAELKKPTWIRFVLVPGWTSDEYNVTELARFVSNLGNVERLELLPFHKLGEPKYERMGLSYPLHDTPVPSTEMIASTREIFESFGIPVV